MVNKTVIVLMLSTSYRWPLLSYGVPASDAL